MMKRTQNTTRGKQPGEGPTLPLLRAARVAACVLAASGASLSLAQDASTTTAPVIDDTTNELDATVVTSTPTPVRRAANQTVRKPTVSRPVEVEVYDTLAPVVIPGGAEATHTLPGSGFFVTSQDIRDQNYTNINRVLAKVPGVYLRDEDGLGIFPNISIRGVDGTRNEKSTIMEDGILQAPAPYAGPATYYFPNTARMAGVEILKGSSQIKFGPSTTGGVINFLSTPIPEHEQFYMRSTYGSNATAKIHSHYGNTIETDMGKIGYLAEIYYGRSDGFRRVEASPLIGPGSDDTGYHLIEPMVKLSWKPNTALEQKFEFKYGYTSLDANESYTGLTDADIAIDPYRRYAGTFLDNIASSQHRTYLKHSIAITDDLDLQTAGYYNKFDRSWQKLERVGGANSSGGGQSPHTVLGPTGNPALLDILRGIAPGVLNYRDNNRSHEAYGVQVSGQYRFETGPLDHSLDFGVRRHTDSTFRLQPHINVTTGGPAPVITSPGLESKRYEQADATAFWLYDTIEIGNLSVSPGIRHERVDLHETRYNAALPNQITQVRNGSTDWWLAGVGFNYDFDGANSVYGGVHEGLTLSGGPSGILNTPVGLAPLKPERSLAYELGARHRSDNFNADLTGFITQIDDLASTRAGLGLDNSQNWGAAEVHGIEFLASYDPFQDRAVRLPLFASATWTDATFLKDTAVGDEIYSGALAGNRIPYVPEWKLALGAGLHTETWGLDLTATYVSDSFGTANNSPVPLTTSRQGLIDGGVIVDLAGHYQINDRTKFVAGVHNLFEEAMITSRSPNGARVNAPREYFIGFEILWEPAVPTGGKSVYSK